MIKCCDVIKEIKTIPSDSACCIICDPPYNNNILTNIVPIEKYVGWCLEWISECYRILKPDGTMFIYGYPETICHVSVNMKDWLITWLVWSYKNKACPQFLSDFQRSYESILCCRKNNKFIYNVDEIRESYSDTFLKVAAGKVRKATKGRYSRGDKETIYNAHPGGALRRSVIEVSALAGGAGMSERWGYCKTCNTCCLNKELKEKHDGHLIIKHPTQKPYKLTEILIKSCKPKNGGLVFIPFCGSGSECAVCEDLGLDYISYEINQDYVNLAEGFLKGRKSRSL